MHVLLVLARRRGARGGVGKAKIEAVAHPHESLQRRPHGRQREWVKIVVVTSGRARAMPHVDPIDALGGSSIRARRSQFDVLCPGGVAMRRARRRHATASSGCFVPSARTVRPDIAKG
jgi:hypothetical protein